MVKLTIHATIALAAVAVGGILGVIVDAPPSLAVAGGVLTVVALQLRGREAFAALLDRLPDPVKQELVLYSTALVGVLEYLNYQIVDTSPWLKAVLAVLAVVAPLLGARRGVTPVVNPKTEDGSPLVPAGVPPGNAPRVTASTPVTLTRTTLPS